NWAGDLVLHEEYQGAEAAYARSLTLFDSDPNVYDDLASLYRRTGRCEASIALYRRALALDPTRGQTTIRLIGCLVDRGRFAEARALAQEQVDQGVSAFESIVPLVDSAARASRSDR